MPKLIGDHQKAELLNKYCKRFIVPELGYGTVRDYCDSCDSLPFLSCRQGDLKDLQRPWAAKAVMGLCAPGSRLLEIGAGEPVVAQLLADLGYVVTVVDPYDGSGNGPTEFDENRRAYPDVDLRRALFSRSLTGLQAGSFDCIYSISVLEHIPEPALTRLFEGIRTYVRPSGWSLHAIDHVIAGSGAGFHRSHLERIQELQWSIAAESATGAIAPLAAVIGRLQTDLDTCYLSASGHNLWRGNRPYDEFPFRQVVSIQSCHREGHVPGKL